MLHLHIPPCPIPPRAVDAVVVLREQLRQERENHAHTLMVLRKLVQCIDKLWPDTEGLERPDSIMALARDALEQFGGQS